MNKPFRDAAVSGAPSVLVMGALVGAGVPAELATALSVVTSVFASAAYRWVRARWPWLLAVDAPGGAK